MAQSMVEFRGGQVVEGWPERVEEAQRLPSYTFQGVPLPRIRYGNEMNECGAIAHPCNDCSVAKRSEAERRLMLGATGGSGGQHPSGTWQ
jgi:hypothetical protein